MPPARTLTQLLRQWSEGDEEAAAEAMPLVYEELHRLAVRCLQRERSAHTLSATDIVHEVYLEIRAEDAHWEDRTHFIALTVRMMRRILVRYARKRNAAKRGRGFELVTLIEEEVPEVPSGRSPALEALDEALKALEEVDPRKVSIVEMHYFGGLSLDEIANVVDISRATVVRELRSARAWLYREIRRGEGRGDGP